MEKQLSFLTLLLALSVAGYTQTDSSRLKGFNAPVAGETITLTYQPEGGPLEEKHNINGIIYLFDNYSWQIDDIKLKENNGKWQGVYPVPGNCAFVAIKLVAEEKGIMIASDNNNDFGYVATTLDKNGAGMPGGALAWAIFRKPSLHKAPDAYFNKFEIGDEALEMWIRKEMKFYPDNMPQYFDSYIAMLRIKLGDEFAALAPRNLEKFGRFPGITESGYITIMDTYQFQLKNKEKADSIRRVILQKYPKGRVARLERYSQAYLSPMNDKKIAALENFLNDFPVAEYRKESAGTQNFIYYNTYRSLATAYIATGEKQKLLMHLPAMGFMTLNEVYRYNFDATFTIGKIPVEKLYPLADMVMTEMIKKSRDTSYMEGTRYTPRQALEFAQAQFDNRLAIHIVMLNKIGKYKEALPLLSCLSENGRYANASLNEARINIYEHTGNRKKVQQALETSVQSGAATATILEKLEKSFKGKSIAFPAYLDSIKGAEGIKQAKDTLKSQLINEKIADFQLRDINGNTINSAGWKDKIIVLDYWATWCFPCKMAFPGMQMAVDKYRNDTTVSFYFIATMERAENYQQKIKDYIRTSGYRFQVLDDEESRVFKSMTPIFHSSAIPRKVVMKNNAIRYTSEGYNGSPSGLADEISYVVELLKSDKE